MCSLQEHIEREIRERQAAAVVTLPPQQGMTTKPRQHAEDCTCWHSHEHGYIIGAPCIKVWAGEPLAALNQSPMDQDGGEVTHGTA